MSFSSVSQALSKSKGWQIVVVNVMGRNDPYCRIQDTANERSTVRHKIMIRRG